MDEMISSNSVLRAYFRISALVDEIRNAHRHFSPLLYGFDSFRGQIKLLHQGILTLLSVISAPLQEFIALGLRTSEEEWNNPPLSTQVAIEGVRRIVEAMDPFINLTNGRRHVPNYDPLFHIDFGNAIISIRSLYDEDEAFDFSFLGNLQGATPEQISKLPVYTATQEDTDQECRICFDNFVAGEKIRILACSHRFHKKCIDSWLINSATCPLDRYIVCPS